MVMELLLGAASLVFRVMIYIFIRNKIVSMSPFLFFSFLFGNLIISLITPFIFSGRFIMVRLLQKFGRFVNFISTIKLAYLKSCGS